MAIRDWHPGKVVMLWGAVVGWWVFVQPNLGSDEVQELAAFIGVLAVVAVFVVTWQWFSGRQRSRSDQKE